MFVNLDLDNKHILLDGWILELGFLCLEYFIYMFFYYIKIKYDIWKEKDVNFIYIYILRFTLKKMS